MHKSHVLDLYVLLQVFSGLEIALIQMFPFLYKPFEGHGRASAKFYRIAVDYTSYRGELEALVAVAVIEGNLRSIGAAVCSASHDIDVFRKCTRVDMRGATIRDARHFLISASDKSSVA